MNETPGAENYVKVPDGEALKKQVSATYLDNDLKSRADLTVEVAHKICETRKTWLKLAANWKASEARTTWQLLI